MFALSESGDGRPWEDYSIRDYLMYIDELESASVNMGLPPEEVLTHIRDMRRDWVSGLTSGTMDSPTFSLLVERVTRLFDLFGFDNQEKILELQSIRSEIITEAQRSNAVGLDWFGSALESLYAAEAQMGFEEARVLALPVMCSFIENPAEE